jgi:hypothetical protein
VKLFLYQIRTKKKRRVLDVLVHARGKKAAGAHLEKRYAGHEVIRSTELPAVTKHFVVGEYDD